MVKSLPANVGDTGFDPWSGKIPHAVEQLSPCTTTTEPVLYNPRATTTEARAPRAHAPQQEKPLQRGATAMRNPHTTTKGSPCSLQLEKARAKQQRPNAAKNK